MGRNLGPLNIKDSYEGLVQISGSDQLTDGSGSLISSLDILASTATSASHAVNADTAISASWSDQAGTAGFATTATSASWADQAGTSGFATNATSASFADQSGTSGFATTATSASFATTSSFALNSTPNTLQEVLNAGDTATGDINLTGDINATNITASGADFTNVIVGDISGSNASFTSASIGYLQTITGSAKIIGDAFIILNNDTPTERYAGVVVQDSGSTANTASLLFDGQTNDWFYQYTDDGGATDEFGVVMFGPGYNTQGAHVYPSNNTILKGTGDHHIVDSSITDDGTLVTIDANVSASGYISASTYYGDGSNLDGIVSTDTTYDLISAQVGSDVDVKLSGSDATIDTVTLVAGTNVTLTDDGSNNITIDATGGGGAAFPYTGSAEISGSLRVLTDGVVDGYTITSGSLSGSLVDNLGQQSVGTTTAIKHMVYCTQTEYDGITPDDNTLYVISGSETLGDTVVSGSLIGEVNTLTDAAGTTTLDCSLGNYFTLAMPAGGTTALTPTNIQIGQTINIKITQNATASTLTYAGTIEFPGGTAFTISTGSGEVDVLTLVSFDGTTLQATGLANFS